MTTSVLTQLSFRGRKDNVTLNSTTFDDPNQPTSTNLAINTNWTQPVDVNFRVRINVQESGNKQGNFTFKAQYTLVGGTFADITASTPIQVVDSPNYADGDGTTQLLNGTGTFSAGVGDDNDNVMPSAGNTSIPANGNTEYEINLRIDSAQVTNGQQYQIRLVQSNGTALNAYTNTPTITVLEAVPMELHQALYRGRKDNQTLNSATFHDPGIEVDTGIAANTPWTQPVDTNFRVRWVIQEAAAVAGSAKFKLQYNLAAGGWFDVGAATPIQIAASANFADDDATTDVIGGTGTFAAGVGDDADNLMPTTGTISFVASGHTELETCLLVDSAQVTNSQTFQLRIVLDNGTPLTGYSNTPTVTVQEPATVTDTFTADAIVQQTVTATFTADTIIKKTVTTGFTADAVLQKSTTTGVSADSILQKAATAAFSADAFLEEYPGVSTPFTADSYLVPLGRARVTWANARSKKRNIQARAIIKKGISDSFTADAIIAKQNSANFTADAVISEAVYTFTADAVVLITVITGFAADAVLQKDITATFTADAVIEAAIHTFTADAEIIHTVVVSPSTNVAASGESTTAQLNPPGAKTTGDFVAGRLQDDENPTDSIDIPVDNYTEIEWVLKILAPIGTSYEFRVTLNGTPIDAYAVTPVITVSSLVEVSENITADAIISKAATQTFTANSAIVESKIDQSAYRWRNDDGDEINATWRQLENTPDTVDPGTMVRLRVQLNATGDPESIQFQFEYRVQGTTEWKTITVEINEPALLLESGHRILLEDGSYLLLE